MNIKKLLSGAIAAVAVVSAIPAFAASLQANLGVAAQAEVGPQINIQGQGNVSAQGQIQGQNQNYYNYPQYQSGPNGTTTENWNHGNMDLNNMVVGTVTAVNGTTLTVARGGFNLMGQATSSASVTYTVDASNAIVLKDNATSSIADISVNDHVIVEGNVTGNTVVATTVRDIVVQNYMGRVGNGGSSTPPFTGNGEPIVAGKVTAVSGSTLTITNSSNVTYTVDATNAKIVAGINGEVSSLANIAVGDTVVVQGTVNGTAVTASTVINQTSSVNNNNGNGTSTFDNQDHVSFVASLGGFFGGIGHFFQHLFGF